jgi:hypothetical protein
MHLASLRTSVSEDEYGLSVYLVTLICDTVFQGLLEGVSYSFTKNFHFIDSVKAYLSYALLRASVSQSPVIFQVYLINFFFFSLSDLSESAMRISVADYNLYISFLAVRNWSFLRSFVAIQGKS